MKKSLIALVLLGTVAGAAQAASSVTLYGRADVGYSKVTGSALTQSGNGQTRLGLMGNEDLGNGLAATFKLEGRFDLDTGAKTSTSAESMLAFFDRESTVGLKGSFGHVRFGRALASMENGIGFVNIGRRAADISPYSSSARVSNGLFYAYKAGSIEAGGHITTKGSLAEDGDAYVDDGVSGAKPAYGVYGKYAANGLTVGLGYQADNSTQKNEYGVGLSYAKGMFGGGASFAAGKTSTLDKTRVLQAYLAVNVTPNDTIAGVYSNKRNKSAMSVVTKNLTTYGLEYVHAMSKRTSVYANAARVNNKVKDTKTNVFEVALRHNF